MNTFTGVEQYSGTSRTDYRGLSQQYNGRAALSQSTVRTTPTCCLIWEVLNVVFYPSVELHMKSLLTEMVSGTFRTRYISVYVITVLMVK